MAHLSDNPTNTDLEDFVAAHLASRGVFVETGVTERDPQDILELDVVWTDYRTPEAPRNPIEVKSREWQLGDLFKYYGWTHYLGLPPGSFACRQMPGRMDNASVDKLMARLNVQLIHIEDPKKCDEKFAILDLPTPAAPYLPELWRFSFWAQRRLLLSLKPAIERDVCPQSARKAKDYFKLVNDAVFFEPDVRVRVGRLIRTHFEHPKLAATAAAEIGGRGVDFEDPPNTAEFRQALIRGTHCPVQSCLYLAHRGRLAIVKTAVDYILATQRGEMKQPVDPIFGSPDGDFGLYSGFKKALDDLAQAPHFHHYAVFWQAFLFVWGGFILEDHQESEYAALSAQTGVPVEEIDNAFRVFDALFHVPGGWFVRPEGSSRRVVKLMPAPLRGIGAYNRLQMHGVEKYMELGYHDQTTRHLALEHDTAVRLLDGNEDDLIR